MKQIIITKPGVLSAAHQHKLESNGFVVIESENPEQIKIITPLDEITGNSVMYSALEALAIAGANTQSKFTTEFARRILALEVKPKE